MQTAMAKKLEEQMTVRLDRLSPGAVLELVRVSSENFNSRVIRQFITGAKTRFEGGSAKAPSTKMLAPVLPLFHTVAVRQLAPSRF